MKGTICFLVVVLITVWNTCCAQDDNSAPWEMWGNEGARIGMAMAKKQMDQQSGGPGGNGANGKPRYAGKGEGPDPFDPMTWYGGGPGNPYSQTGDDNNENQGDNRGNRNDDRDGDDDDRNDDGQYRSPKLGQKEDCAVRTKEAIKCNKRSKTADKTCLNFCKERDCSFVKCDKICECKCCED